MLKRRVTFSSEFSVDLNSTDEIVITNSSGNSIRVSAMPDGSLRVISQSHKLKLTQVSMPTRFNIVRFIH